MSDGSDAVAGAVAHHQIANLLYTYVDVADRKDVDAVIDLVGGGRVRFPAGGADSPATARTFFTELWASPTPHRHDVSNLRVLRGHAGTWTAHANYVRWILDPDPVLHTLGEYRLVVRGADWTLAELTVNRTWSRE